MDALYLTHTGHRGIVQAANHVWYSYLHRDVVTTAQNCKNCRNKCKNLKAISGKKHYTLLDAVVETNKENRLDFSGPLPNKNRKEIYILVGVDHFSRFPYTKVVTDNKGYKHSFYAKSYSKSWCAT